MHETAAAAANGTSITTHLFALKFTYRGAQEVEEEIKVLTTFLSFFAYNN
jgi:hypothetical protein